MEPSLTWSMKMKVQKAISNILEWLQGRVAGLQIYHTRYGAPVPLSAIQEPAFL
jgi:hypothetical protein